MVSVLPWQGPSPRSTAERAGRWRRRRARAHRPAPLVAGAVAGAVGAAGGAVVGDRQDVVAGADHDTAPVGRPVALESAVAVGDAAPHLGVGTTRPSSVSSPVSTRSSPSQRTRPTSPSPSDRSSPVQVEVVAPTEQRVAPRRRAGERHRGDDVAVAVARDAQVCVGALGLQPDDVGVLGGGAAVDDQRHAPHAPRNRSGTGSDLGTALTTGPPGRGAANAVIGASRARASGPTSTCGERSTRWICSTAPPSSSRSTLSRMSTPSSPSVAPGVGQHPDVQHRRLGPGGQHLVGHPLRLGRRRRHVRGDQVRPQHVPLVLGQVLDRGSPRGRSVPGRRRSSLTQCGPTCRCRKPVWSYMPSVSSCRYQRCSTSTWFSM